MKLLGYKYLDELSAIEASDSLNQYYGVPTSEYAKTTSIIIINYGMDENMVNIWYIIYHPLCLPVLGLPSEFEIFENDDDNININ